MKTHHPTLYALAAFVILLSSCQIDPVAPLIGGVPEMPYRPRPVVITEPEPEQTTTWETAPSADSYITAAPTPAPPVRAADPAPAIPEPVAAAPAVAPAPVPAPKPAEVQPLDMSSFSAPAPAPVPAAPAAPAPSAADLSQITNNGPIPTAARVEGDPTRVWNPLDPSKKIRIINPKTNQPYPSGKKLKVRGTNFQFYVP